MKFATLLMQNNIFNDTKMDPIIQKEMKYIL